MPNFERGKVTITLKDFSGSVTLLSNNLDTGNEGDGEHVGDIKEGDEENKNTEQDEGEDKINTGECGQGDNQKCVINLVEPVFKNY